MSGSLNKAALIGRLGQDPEVRKTKDDKTSTLLLMLAALQPAYGMITLSR